MKLHTSGIARGFQRPIVARVATRPAPVGMRKDTVLVLPSVNHESDFRGYAALIVQQNADNLPTSLPLVHSVRDISHLSSGYIVALEPLNGFVRTLYRPESPHNT